ncbi:RteC domain-containing protein [Mucilaginibacter sp. UR6-1]|uniref:RteC domain-containing protein n=1 Tax=Mucilaginibacter sp. UR6-1 TaxID=1435643 RepID=UPI001E36EE15|nr:RteC domain-containing protein [Mucilaginibacter sp. UR6-1]MCC8407723.1 RteC domain-containing protein [Mucilaginibacter sp. UR6-1]
MDQQLEEIKKVLNEDILELNEMEPGLERLNLMLKAIDTAIAAVNQVRDQLKFTDVDEEIFFFKYFQPEILAKRIEEIMKYHIHMHVPIGTDASRIRYYEDELKARKSFFRMNNFHYQYFKTGLTDLDRHYFLADAAPLSVPAADLSEFGNQFSTPMTYLFAKFIAYECIQYYLLEQIAQVTHPELHAVRSAQPVSDLRWTGDAVNIVELAYGLWLTGQLNHGNASLNQIVRWLESSLQVSIGIVQRRFNEIERRKRLSFTKFIDQMKEAILRKIDSDNS